MFFIHFERLCDAQGRFFQHFKKGGGGGCERVNTYMLDKSISSLPLNRFLKAECEILSTFQDLNDSGIRMSIF